MSAVTALAEIDPQDVLPIILQLKSAVRGVQRFTQVKIFSYIRFFDQLWCTTANCAEYVGANSHTRIKKGLFASMFAIRLFGAWMDDRIERPMQRVLVVTLIFYLGVIYRRREELRVGRLWIHGSAYENVCHISTGILASNRSYVQVIFQVFRYIYIGTCLQR